MMDKQELNIGDVVQINPEHDPVFGACLMTVTEPKPWGAMGYVQVPDENDDGGTVFYRCKFANMEYVGRAAFVEERYLTAAGS